MTDIVSRETQERLEAYCALVQKWNPRVNLVSKTSLKDLWSRHIEDSLQLLEVQGDRSRWVDLGSGGGFPGLVIACVLRDIQADAVISLVESDQRKAVFLRTVARELDLNVQVFADRIENVAPLMASVLSARALAPLPKLLGYAKLHLHADGQAVLPKGANWEKEVADARQEWSFECRQLNSQTDESASILVIRDIKKL